MVCQKQYIIDTNVLLEDPQAVFKLSNRNENSVYIPYHVLLELDKLKKNSIAGGHEGNWGRKNRSF